MHSILHQFALISGIFMGIKRSINFQYGTGFDLLVKNTKYLSSLVLVISGINKLPRAGRDPGSKNVRHGLSILILTIALGVYTLF